MEEVTLAEALPTNQDERGWGVVIEYVRRTHQVPRTKVEYDKKNNPQAWMTAMRFVLDIKRYLSRDSNNGSVLL